MPCLIADTVVVCRPDLTRTVLGRERAARWCFGCRTKSRHIKVRYHEELRWTKSGELINGYYEPFVKLECPTCGKEDIYFPGWEPA